jgi:hypothetical protein
VEGVFHARVARNCDFSQCPLRTRHSSTSAKAKDQGLVQPRKLSGLQTGSDRGRSPVRLQPVQGPRAANKSIELQGL